MRLTVQDVLVRAGSVADIVAGLQAPPRTPNLEIALLDTLTCMLGQAAWSAEAGHGGVVSAAPARTVMDDFDAASGVAAVKNALHRQIRGSASDDVDIATSDAIVRACLRVICIMCREEAAAAASKAAAARNRTAFLRVRGLSYLLDALSDPGVEAGMLRSICSALSSLCDAKWREPDASPTADPAARSEAAAVFEESQVVRELLVQIEKQFNKKGGQQLSSPAVAALFGALAEVLKLGDALKAQYSSLKGRALAMSVLLPTAGGPQLDTAARTAALYSLACSFGSHAPSAGGAPPVDSALPGQLIRAVQGAASLEEVDAAAKCIIAACRVQPVVIAEFQRGQLQFFLRQAQAAAGAGAGAGMGAVAGAGAGAGRGAPGSDSQPRAAVVLLAML